MEKVWRNNNQLYKRVTSRSRWVLQKRVCVKEYFKMIKMRNLK